MNKYVIVHRGSDSLKNLSFEDVYDSYREACDAAEDAKEMYDLEDGVQFIYELEITHIKDI